MEFYRPTWAEIDLSSFRHNVSILQAHIGPNKRIMAVVKANGYGHGAIPIARAAIQAGVTYLGVASIDEAVELRDGGVDASIQVLGYSSPQFASVIAEYDLTQTVFSEDMLQALHREGLKQKKKAKIHVKVDTGMGRLGFLDMEEAIRFVRTAVSLDGVELEGVFTHLATAEDTDFQYAQIQHQKWFDFLRAIRELGIQIPYYHISNSGAGIQHLEMETNLARFGLSLYGIYPAPHLSQLVPDLKPILKLSSRIVHVQTHAAGDGISYGSTFKTQDGTRIATVPIGYADGYTRRLSNKGHVLLRGKRVPIAGNICMDQLMLDVTQVPDVQIGDEVVLYGSQGLESISVDEIAELTGTIPYEILCALGRRVPRLYLEDGQIVETRRWS